MFKHVLLPVDLSPRNEMAVDAAARICDPGGRITLIHVIEPILDMPFEEGRSFYMEIERTAAHKMEQLARRLTLGHSVHHQLLYGNRVAEILSFAEDNDVDLLVMASHALDRDQPHLGWGTLSYRVGVLTRCPVLLVKEPLKP